jgi:hypothetical protein
MHTRHHLEQLALASLTEDACPETDELAAYVLGTLDGAAQLRVAAHVRGCELCRHDLVVCRPPEPRPRRLIARLLPQALAEGRRGDNVRPNVRQYVVADLTVELTIAPPSGERWRITGQVVRAGHGVADQVVLLRAGRRRYQQTSDAHGFFTFTDLPAGRYTLDVTDGEVQVRIQALTLRE